MGSHTEASPASPASPVPFRRFLRAIDIFFVCVVSTVNLSLLTSTASAGFRVFWLWLLAIPCFVIPQAIAVAEISFSDPGEGGLALWSGRYLGERVGFLTSWCYWLNNVPYVPSLMVYIVATVSYVFPRLQTINPAWHLMFAMAGLWSIVALNVVGVGTRRWVNVTGACSTLLAVGLVIWMGARYFATHPGPLVPGAGEGQTWGIPPLNLETTSVFGLVCMSMIGVEIGSVFGAEISASRAATAWAAIRASGASLFCYVAATAALLAGMSGAPLGSASGLMDYVRHIMEGAMRGRAIAAMAALICISLAGAGLCWFAAAARMLWLCAVEGGLRPSLQRLHPQWRTPDRAMRAQGILSSGVLVLGFLGAATQEAYVTLLDIAVIIQLLPYVAIFLGLIRHGLAQAPPRRWLSVISGTLGCGATLFGTAMAFIPSRAISSIWQYEIKLCTGCLLCVGLGFWVFARRQQAPALNVVYQKS
ncbi:MAG: APC family permease [Acidobacteriia bacterium]|nr:APC family permease [Terriglobia bacterium]